MPTPAKLQVVQAYDRAPITEIDTDDAAALELKLATATQVFRDRKGWLPVYQRIDVLRRLAALIETRRDHFSRLIAQEGGKPLTDAIVETTRAIDGVRNAADELRNFAGREIPMSLTPTSTGRLAFTTREPIGVVVAISALAVMINDHTAFRTDWMPFAGRRESGYGVGGIPFSMREMTQEKMRVFRYRA